MAVIIEPAPEQDRLPPIRRPAPQAQPPSKIPPINVTTHPTDSQRSSLTERAFEQLGKLVAAWPWAFLLLSLCLGCFSYGMRYIRMEDRLRDGYTPSNAPSNYETAVYNEFFGKADRKPLTMIMIVEARDGRSVIRPKYLNETIATSQFFLNNFTVAKLDSTTEAKYTFSDLCEPNCGVNKIFEIFRDNVELQESNIASGKGLAPEIKMNYPLGEIRHVGISFASRFFRVIRWEKDGLARPTNMKSVKAFMLLFRAEINTTEEQDLVKRWHRQLFIHMKEKHQNELLDVKILSTTILSDEMNGSSQRAIPFFILGFVLMTTFVIASLVGTSLYAGERINCGKIIIGIGAVISPVLAITSTFGLMSLLGSRTNSIMLITPFLIMAIGVDDAFLMMNSWHHARHKPVQQGSAVENSVERLMMFVFKDSGPSIFITSLTNTVAFGVGALTPTPEIRLFCRAAAVAMLFDFVYEITLFGAFLAFASRISAERKPTDEPKAPSRLQKFMNESLKRYCTLLNQRSTLAVVGVLTALLLAASIHGVVNFEAKLDAAKVIPQDSPMQETNRALESMVWNDYHPVTVMINKRTDLSDGHQYAELKKMVAEFEALDHTLGPEATQIWLKDYFVYVNLRRNEEHLFDILFDDSLTTTTIIPLTSESVDLTHVEDFFTHDAFKGWEGMVKWSVRNGTPNIDKFVYFCAYHGTASWAVRIDLMQKWRTIAAKYELFNASVWETNAPFVDQMLSAKRVTLQTVLTTLIVMSVVCLLFIPSLSSVCCASLAIGSICLGVVGFMRHWDVNLDPIVMAALLMSIGLSVDFTAHTSYHYYQTGNINQGSLSSVERLERTMDAIAWPMVQAGCSTICCVLPLTLLRGQYAPEIFFKTMLLVVLFGLVHGLVILPAVLVALPPRFTARRQGVRSGGGCRRYRLQWCIRADDRVHDAGVDANA